MQMDTPEEHLDLDRFLPYQLAVLAETVSRSMAQIYGERFDLSRDEWRVLAALPNQNLVRTATVIAHTTLDKVSASRALRRLEEKQLVERVTDPHDGRGYMIRLLPPGRRLFQKIVPMVLAREQFLLEDLDANERATLDRAFHKLLSRARQLTQQG